MAVVNWNGRLNSNEVYSDLYNVILRHVVFSDNIDDTKASLLDMSRVDGGLYGDTILFTSFDIGETYEWLGDQEAANLLNVNRNKTEVTQAVVLDKFRQINLTTDDYLSKRAWTDATAFGQFNSALLQNIQDTRRVFDSRYFNTFIGTHETNVGKQLLQITLQKEEENETPEQTEARNRINAQTIAAFMADLMVDMEDTTRDYNDYEYLRSVNSNDLIAVWNSEWVNKITHLDTPTIYNRDKALADKFGEYTLPARYFGTILSSGGTTGAANITVRTLIERKIGNKTYFPGDLLPASTEYNAGEAYTEDNTIAFKIMHKKSVPYMVGFSTATEFFNPRALNQNHYLTWGYNTLQHLYNLPFVTVRAVPAV